MNLDNSNFKEVINGDLPVMVDFWAPWCGPCKMLAPTIDALVKEIPSDKAVVAKVNVDDCPDIAQEYNITQIPTIVFFKNAKELGRTGMSTKENLAKTLLDL
ncbi:MAG: thioredoxin [Opitutales bacterium]